MKTDPTDPGPAAETTMTDRELDEAVGHAIGRISETVWICSRDSGKSSCADTSRDGPWFTKADLQKWLSDQQSRGFHTEYELMSWEKWPRYSTDISAAFQILVTLALPSMIGFKWAKPAAPHFCCINLANDEQVTSHADSVPRAICLAALKAKGTHAPH